MNASVAQRTGPLSDTIGQLDQLRLPTGWALFAKFRTPAAPLKEIEVRRAISVDLPVLPAIHVIPVIRVRRAKRPRKARSSATPAVRRPRRARKIRSGPRAGAAAPPKVGRKKRSVKQRKKKQR